MKWFGKHVDVDKREELRNLIYDYGMLCTKNAKNPNVANVSE